LHSELARFGKTVWRRRFLRQFVLRFPVSPAHFFNSPIWVCEKLCRFPVMQKAGLRFLGFARGIVELRTAVKEAGSWKALQHEFGMRLPVLLYHHVGPRRPGTIPGLTVSPERFERQVRWLARRGHVGIRPSDWVCWRREGKGLPDKPILLTFDDGYADIAEYALPVLRRYGFGAAVYIVTGQLAGTNTWDEVRGSGTHGLMTAEQIRYWATQGIEFGAHSRTHADLTTLSAKELAEEVIGSRDDLADLLGSRVVSFAYPYGFYNQAVVDCVRGAFDLAFVADDKREGLNHLLIDPYLLLRTMVQTNDSLLDLECRARWGYNPLLNLRARLRLRSRLKRVARSILGGNRPSSPQE
jgi:peptidoglycan/xylan/chitin deacetylase (PgdA/CDA1 family)